MQTYGAPYPNPSGIAKGYASATGTTLTEIIPLPGPGAALMITCLVVHNSHATTGTSVDLYSGTTKIWGPIPAPPGNGGAVLVPLMPPLPCNENEAFQFKAAAG